MLEGHKKAAEAREKDLEARLSAKFAAELEQDREKHASDVETIHEKIKVVDDKLENLKTRIGELQEKVNDREGGQNTDEVSTKTKKLARANRELIGILRRDLGELRDEWETSKGALQQADRDRDDRLQHISDEINASKADQANIKRVEKRLHSLEWKVTERVDVAPGGTSKSKGKRKRKEKNQEKELEHEMTSNAQMPDIADADEAMDDDDAAP